jgi:hypothetical protein
MKKYRMKRLRSMGEKNLKCVVNIGWEILWDDTSSSVGPVSIIVPVSTSALGLSCDPKYSTQHRFSSPVPLTERQRSLTEVVLISFGSTSGFPKTLKH